MNPVHQWIQKEAHLFLIQFLKFSDYYILRDRLPFYVTLTYILGRNSESKIPKYISSFFLLLASEVGIVAIYYLLAGIPNDQLVGFTWRYSAPIQYTVQILIISYIAWRTTKNIPYSVALGYNGAAATGYLYEIAFWLYSFKPEAHLLRTNYQFTFLISYQIIAIGVFIWLLRKQGIKTGKKDFTIFMGVFGFTILMASQLYVIESASIARTSMILYSIYLSLKLCNLSPPNALDEVRDLCTYHEDEGDLCIDPCPHTRERLVTSIPTMKQTPQFCEDTDKEDLDG